MHARVEGKSEYTQLLYLPAKAPFDLYGRNVRHGIKLYVRRVFIMDDAEQLLPTYLRFVRGIVDSADLPLNVSREILQESKDIEAIRKGCTAKVLGMLTDMAANDKEKYATFWEAFGRVIKEGVGEDFANKEKIAGLLRFASTHHDTTEQTVSLADYISRMKPEQEKIYYVTADTFNAARNSPHLEVFRKKGIEVLLLTDPVDAFWTAAPLDFGGKPLKSLSQGDVDFSLIPLLDDKAETKDETAADEATTIAVIKDALGERVSDVRASQRLTSSASCLVAGGDGRDRALERLLAQQNRGALTRPILEINLRHPLVAAIASEKDAAKDLSLLLLEQAQILEGELPEDPAAFAGRLNQLVLRGLAKG